jgi:hypothetical protein
MRGSIVKKNDTYYIVLDDPLSTDKRRRKWIKGSSSKKETERQLSEYLHQIDTGAYINPGKMTIKDYLSQWIKDYQVNLSPRGFERYQGIVESHLKPRLGHFNLIQLRPEHIQKF